MREKVCPGCGQTMGSFAHHTHAAACKRDQVKPGMIFRVMTATYKDGKPVRRPIEVEILERSGEGWLARALASKRTLFLKSYKRFIDWDKFSPGLEKNDKRNKKIA